MTEERIIIPDGIDPETAREILSQHAENAARRHRLAELDRAALETGEGLQQWIREARYPDVIVRASTYGNKQIHFDQEIWQASNRFGMDERRPVFMRGCIGSMIASHARGAANHPNHLINDIVIRFLSRIRYSCTSEKKHYAFANAAFKKLRDKLGWSPYARTSFILFEKDVKRKGEPGGPRYWDNGSYIDGMSNAQAVVKHPQSPARPSHKTVIVSIICQTQIRRIKDRNWRRALEELSLTGQ